MRRGAAEQVPGATPLRRAKQMIRQERLHAGQGLLEYALIIVLVAIVVMAVLLLLGPAIGNMFSNIVAAI